MNNKAKDFLKLLADPDNGQRRLGNVKIATFYSLSRYGRLLRLKEQIEKNSSEIIPLPINRILKLSEYKNYSLCSQILTKEMSLENRPFLSY